MQTYGGMQVLEEKKGKRKRGRPRKDVRSEDVRHIPRSEQEAMLGRMLDIASTPRKVNIHQVGERWI